MGITKTLSPYLKREKYSLAFSKGKLYGIRGVGIGLPLGIQSFSLKNLWPCAYYIYQAQISAGIT